MDITIVRRRFTPWSVDGTLVINGVYFTGTVEHPKKYLPAGGYKVALVPIKFVKELRIMPTILGRKERVPKKPVIRQSYFKPGFGPFALKHGSIVMGKSLKTGLVAYNEEKFQEFCIMISDALQKKEKVTLAIMDWGKDDIPKEEMVVLPNNVPAKKVPSKKFPSKKVPAKNNRK